MTAWVCSECRTKNRGAGRFCEQCGSARNPALSTAPAASPLPWQRPEFKPSRPEDRCDEPGCTLTVRDHMREFADFTSRPNTVFTRARVQTDGTAGEGKP